MLLLYFFFLTGVGLNARLSDLVAGGKPLIIVLAITIIFLLIQNAIANRGELLARPSARNVICCLDQHLSSAVMGRQLPGPPSSQTVSGLRTPWRSALPARHLGWS